MVVALFPVDTTVQCIAMELQPRLSSSVNRQNGLLGMC